MQQSTPVNTCPAQVGVSVDHPVVINAAPVTLQTLDTHKIRLVRVINAVERHKYRAWPPDLYVRHHAFLI